MYPSKPTKGIKHIGKYDVYFHKEENGFDYRVVIEVVSSGMQWKTGYMMKDKAWYAYKRFNSVRSIEKAVKIMQENMSR